MHRKSGIDIIVVSWNNQPFLQCLLDSIQKNTVFDHKVLIHVNEGTDGTREWLDALDIEYSDTLVNVGQSAATNIAAANGSSEYLYIVDDDMYVLPGWDTKLAEVVNTYDFGHKLWLSSIMIEPHRPAPHALSPYHFGGHPNFLREDELLSKFTEIESSRQPFVSSHWPLLTTRRFWEDLGGCDERFPWGLGIEIDMLTKAWAAGSRNPVCIPSSRVYHFQSQSTRRIDKYEDVTKLRDEIIHERVGMDREVWLRDVMEKNSIWTYKENV